MQLNIFSTADEVLTALAAHFVEVANEAITARGKFTVSLSGGSSPKKLYQLLASPAFKGQVNWEKVYFFFGDERYVPHTDPESNYLMAQKSFFDTLEIDRANIFPVDTTLSPDDAAKKYTDEIEQFFDDEELAFDLVLLGLGDDAHTASLFPHTPVLHDTTPSVKANYLQDKQVYRITMNAPLINESRHIAFLVYGESKAGAVRHIMEDEEDIDNYPAQLIDSITGEVQWFLDEAAAADLEER